MGLCASFGSPLLCAMADFRQFVVWQRAHALTLAVYRVTANFPATERFGLSDQIRRAAVSIGANIAEGSARGKRDFARYLSIAIGSANELEYLLQLATDLRFMDDGALASEATQIARMLVRLRQAVLQRRRDATSR